MFIQAPLHLTGHHNNVSALAFGVETTPLLLCSASEDYVIMWDIERCNRQVRKGNKAVVHGTSVIYQMHLHVQYDLVKSYTMHFTCI